MVIRGRCPKHKAIQRRFEDDGRGTSAERGYGAPWRQARAEYLAQHPYCECPQCAASDDPDPADTVDHIVPHKGDQRLFWDRSNWRAMSWSHHSRKTATEDGGFGR